MTTLFLQSPCREVIEIFNKKQETGKYAALHTLMSGAMRAGYCIGILQQFINSSPCCRNEYSYYIIGDYFNIGYFRYGWGAKSLLAK